MFYVIIPERAERCVGRDLTGGVKAAGSQTPPLRTETARTRRPLASPLPVSPALPAQCSPALQNEPPFRQSCEFSTQYLVPNATKSNRRQHAASPQPASPDVLRCREGRCHHCVGDDHLSDFNTPQIISFPPVDSFRSADESGPKKVIKKQA